MSMTVSDQIIQVIDNLCEKFGLVVDWTSENAVPYISTLCAKLVSYEIWTSVAWLGIMLIGFLTVCALVKKHKAGIKDLIETDEVFIILFGIFGTTGGAAAIGGIIQQIMDIIKCLTFPEMFIFEYIQGVINAAH